MINKLKKSLTDFEVTNEELAILILLIMAFVQAGLATTYTNDPVHFSPIIFVLVLDVIMIVLYYIYTNVKKWYSDKKWSETTTEE